jgi:hypothetical protein
MRRIGLLLALAIFALAGCASAPQPSTAEILDACKLLSENRAWYGALRQSAARWGAPMGLQLAIIRQESSFDPRAKPDREDGFLFFRGKRPSSAEGYSQALDGTWEDYKRQSGNGGASRTSFRDSTDFIGWYISNTGKIARVSQYDYRAHYLAYHEGAGGYQQGTWRSKTWLVQIAEKVSYNAVQYERQISTCPALR